jgi:hypothetical protein
MGVGTPGPQRQKGHEADHDQPGEQHPEPRALNAAAGFSSIGRGRTPSAAQQLRQLTAETRKIAVELWQPAPRSRR